jgi:hypothetical protein
MKPKHLSLAIAALLAAGGLWFAWSAWRSDQVASHKSSTGVDFKTIRENAGTSSEKPGENPGRLEPKVSSPGRPQPGQMLRPPEPNRRFTDFTPEQRVEFARKGHGPGG